MPRYLSVSGHRKRSNRLCACRPNDPTVLSYTSPGGIYSIGMVVKMLSNDNNHGYTSFLPFGDSQLTVPSVPTDKPDYNERLCICQHLVFQNCCNLSEQFRRIDNNQSELFPDSRHALIEQIRVQIIRIGMRNSLQHSVRVVIK